MYSYTAMANPFADAEFRWNDWNRGQVAKHNVAEWEAEHVVRDAKGRYARRHRKGTWYAVGRVPGGATLEVAWLRDPPPANTCYVIHAMPL